MTATGPPDGSIPCRATFGTRNQDMASARPRLKPSQGAMIC